MIGRTGIIVALVVLGLSCMSVANAADYAPLDCAKARSSSEKAICSNYALGQSEARVATLYALATSFVAMGQRAEIQDGQRAFLTLRDSCGAVIGCLINAYVLRDKQLSAVLSRIQERGPF